MSAYISPVHCIDPLKFKINYPPFPHYFFLDYVEPRTHANDKAALRRIKVGSSNEHEKTKAASTET